MDVFRKVEEVPANFGPAYVSVGNFDGVHRAHAHVLGEIVTRARGNGGKAVAETVSSTEISKLITTGDVSRARHLVARPFCILGVPGRGRGYGSKYTVPTINLARYEELVPKDGVYITWTRVASERFDSVTNVGNRPTFGAELFAIETHLLNFHPIELTPDTEVEICFLQRLRDEIKFPSVDALREQIAHDVKRARRYFHLLGLSQPQKLNS